MIPVKVEASRCEPAKVESQYVQRERIIQAAITWRRQRIPLNDVERELAAAVDAWIRTQRAALNSPAASV